MENNMKYFAETLKNKLSKAVSCSACEVYDNSEEYVKGNAEYDGSSLEKVFINWIRGKVRIVKSHDETVRIKETCDEELTEEYKVHSLVKNDVLTVHYAASGKNVAEIEEKNVEIELPAGVGICVKTVSASVFCEEMNCEEMSVTTVSGNVVLEKIVTEDKFTVETTSGDINVNIIKSGEKAQLTAVSGDITVSAFSSENLQLNTMSGDVQIKEVDIDGAITADCVSGDLTIEKAKADSITANATNGDIDLYNLLIDGKIALETVSGDAEIDQASASRIKASSTNGNVCVKLGNCEKINVDTVSGGVTLVLTEEVGAEVVFDSSRGSLRTRLSFENDGERYVFGNGKTSVNVSTTLGNLYVK